MSTEANKVRLEKVAAALSLVAPATASFDRAALDARRAKLHLPPDVESRLLEKSQPLVEELDIITGRIGTKDELAGDLERAIEVGHTIRNLSQEAIANEDLRIA